MYRLVDSPIELLWSCKICICDQARTYDCIFDAKGPSFAVFGLKRQAFVLTEFITSCLFIYIIVIIVMTMMKQ